MAASCPRASTPEERFTPELRDKEDVESLERAADPQKDEEEVAKTKTTVEGKQSGSLWNPIRRLLTRALPTERCSCACYVSPACQPSLSPSLSRTPTPPPAPSTCPFGGQTVRYESCCESCPFISVPQDVEEGTEEEAEREKAATEIDRPLSQNPPSQLSGQGSTLRDEPVCFRAVCPQNPQTTQRTRPKGKRRPRRNPPPTSRGIAKHPKGSAQRRQRATTNCRRRGETPPESDSDCSTDGSFIDAASVARSLSVVACTPPPPPLSPFIPPYPSFVRLGGPPITRACNSRCKSPTSVCSRSIRTRPPEVGPVAEPPICPIHHVPIGSSPCCPLLRNSRIAKDETAFGHFRRIYQRQNCHLPEHEVLTGAQSAWEKLNPKFQRMYGPVRTPTHLSPGDSEECDGGCEARGNCGCPRGIGRTLMGMLTKKLVEACKKHLAPPDERQLIESLLGAEVTVKICKFRKLK